jgi:hypothetical protein
LAILESVTRQARCAAAAKEREMTGGPHPIAAIKIAARHRPETDAWTERDRQRLLAELDAEDRQGWMSLSALLMIVAALALVLAVSGAVS